MLEAVQERTRLLFVEKLSAPDAEGDLTMACVQKECSVMVDVHEF